MQVAHVAEARQVTQRDCVLLSGAEPRERRLQRGHRGLGDVGTDMLVVVEPADGHQRAREPAVLPRAHRPPLAA